MFPIDGCLFLSAKSGMRFGVGNVGLVREFFEKLYIIRVQINLVFVTAFHRGNVSVRMSKYFCNIRRMSDTQFVPYTIILHFDFD